MNIVLHFELKITWKSINEIRLPLNYFPCFIFTVSDPEYRSMQLAPSTEKSFMNQPVYMNYTRTTYSRSSIPRLYVLETVTGGWPPFAHDSLDFPVICPHRRSTRSESNMASKTSTDCEQRKHVSLAVWIFDPRRLCVGSLCELL